MVGSNRVGATTGLIVLVCIGTLTLHAVSYLPFIADDALITLRYADRLLDGRGLTWNDGERVEGYSNLLWLLACAGLGRLGLDLIDAARVAGVAASALLMAGVVFASRREPERHPLVALLCGLGLAFTGPVAVWTVGGLEQALLAALLVWSLVAALRLLDTPAPRYPDWLLTAVPLALLCWTRPDGALFTFAVCAGWLCATGISRASLELAAKIAMLPAAAYLLQLAFRLSYYGEWFPNSAYAKLGLTGHRVATGAAYLGGGLAWLAPLALPALLLVLPQLRSDTRAGRHIRFLFAPLWIWCGYTVAVGGDIFPARRHLVPVIVVLVLLLGEGLASVTRRGHRAGRTVWPAALLLLVALGLLQQLDPETRRARTERWEWDGMPIGRLLGSVFAEQQPLMAVDAAGTLPYFSRLPSVDMLGMNDHHIAHNKPADFGHGILGHELGDGAYVLDRKPDLVIFDFPGGGARPTFRSAREMFADSRFRRDYMLVHFEADQPYVFLSQVWVRVFDGRIGIEVARGRVRIPGYLLMMNPQSRARVDGQGRIGVAVDAETPAGLRGLPLEPGSWQLTVEQHGGGRVRSEVRVTAGGPVLTRDGSRAVFNLLPGAAAVDLLIGAAPGERPHVRSVLLERRSAE